MQLKKLNKKLVFILPVMSLGALSCVSQREYSPAVRPLKPWEINEHILLANKIKYYEDKMYKIDDYEFNKNGYKYNQKETDEKLILDYINKKYIKKEDMEYQEYEYYENHVTGEIKYKIPSIERVFLNIVEKHIEREYSRGDFPYDALKTLKGIEKQLREMTRIKLNGININLELGDNEIGIKASIKY